MATTQAPFDAQSLKRYSTSTPINYRVLFVSTALIGGCTFVLVETFKRFGIAKDDFDYVNRLTEPDVKPCGLAVPKMQFIMQSMNHKSDDPFSEHSDVALAEIGRSSLCGAETKVNAIRVAFQQSSIDPVYTSDIYATTGDEIAAEAASEIKIREFVCTCTKGRCGGGDHGDAMRNLYNSYVLSAPAFVRFNEGVSATPTPTYCMVGKDPFGSGGATCASSAIVHEQLANAANDAYKLLRGDIDIEFPDASDMLYRLTALAVLEHYDRKVNDGKCFKNLNSESPIDFCQTMMASKASAPGGGFGTSTGVSKSEEQKYYTNILADTTAVCEIAETPVNRERTFNSSYITSPIVVAVCSSTLEYGLLDIKRLYGVPDPVGEFEFASGHYGNGFTRWLAGITYYGLYDANAGSVVVAFHTARIHLKLYLGYRLAAAAAWGFASVLACGYLIAYATTPLIKLLYKRIAQRLLAPATQISTIVLKPLSAAEYLTTGAAVVSGMWLLFVDPAAHSPYFVNASCTEFATHGGTFASSADREPVGVVAATLTAMPALLLVYLTFFRKKPKNTRIMPLSPFPILPIVLLIVLVLVFIVILCIDCGNTWWDLAKRDYTGNSPGALESFERIMDNSMVVLLFLGVLLGILNQRHLAANAAMNVPFGKTPLYALLWCVCALTASGVATGYAFTFIDCSLEYGIDDIICGDATTFLTRFLGAAAFGLTACSLPIVFFAAFKLLYSIPRRTDLRDASFGMTKRQKIQRLLTVQNSTLNYNGGMRPPDSSARASPARASPARAGGPAQNARQTVRGGRFKGRPSVFASPADAASHQNIFFENVDGSEATNGVVNACFVHINADEKLPLL